MVDGKQVPKKATIYVSGYTPGEIMVENGEGVDSEFVIILPV